MRLSERIALANKLGHDKEADGLIDARDDVFSPRELCNESYARGWQEGRDILLLGEGV